MRVAVMAAGAVGGYFGGRMAAAGNDVAFIARGAHGDAIRRDGLKIESALGDLHLRNVNVTDDPKQVGPVDVVLFAVKLWDTETAGEQTRALVGPNTRVITLQNGVDSVERLAPILACFLLQADARDDGRRSCGWRRVSAGLSGRAGAFGGGFSSNDEGLDGERPSRGQPPRTGLARRQSGRPRTQYGIPTPAQEAVYAILKPYRTGQ